MSSADSQHNINIWPPSTNGYTTTLTMQLLQSFKLFEEKNHISNRELEKCFTSDLYCKTVAIIFKILDRINYNFTQELNKFLSDPGPIYVSGLSLTEYVSE